MQPFGTAVNWCLAGYQERCRLAFSLWEKVAAKQTDVGPKSAFLAIPPHQSHFVRQLLPKEKPRIDAFLSYAKLQFIAPPNQKGDVSI